MPILCGSRFSTLDLCHEYKVIGFMIFVLSVTFTVGTPRYFDFSQAGVYNILKLRRFLAGGEHMYKILHSQLQKLRNVQKVTSDFARSFAAILRQ